MIGPFKNKTDSGQVRKLQIWSPIIMVNVLYFITDIFEISPLMFMNASEKWIFPSTQKELN
jgi:hypothetical protein